MKTIYEAKDFVLKNKDKKVWIKVLGIRNKSEVIEGIISECYNNVFLVKTNTFNRSFSYKDLLVGNVLMKIR